MKQILGLVALAAAVGYFLNPDIATKKVMALLPQIGGGDAEHVLRAETALGEFDGHAHPGILSATMSFTPKGSEDAVVYDLNYPEDYNIHEFDAPQLWHATLRPDLSNNPQVSPIIGNSCLQTIRGEALAPQIQYRTGYRENIVCRLFNEQAAGDDGPYDHDVAVSAVVGLIWANRNHQPIDMPRDRCVAEARIWAAEIARPEDRFMACVFVIDEDPATVAVYGFELTDERIVELGDDGGSWSRKPVQVREASRLMQFRLMQTWLNDEAALSEAQKRLQDHLKANLDSVVPKRLTRLDGIEPLGDRTNLFFVSRNDSEVNGMRQQRDGSIDRHLFGHIRSVVCTTTEFKALLAFQENAGTLEYALSASDGRPMTKYATFTNLPCD